MADDSKPPKVKLSAEEIQGQLARNDKRNEAAKHIVRQTQKQADQLRLAIRALTDQERQGRFMRVIELAELIMKGIDAIQYQLYKTEDKE
ncbi:MAG: hypothetical protein ACLQF0_09360 [Dissulfurispiraceae bacterium]